MTTDDIRLLMKNTSARAASASRETSDIVGGLLYALEQCLKEHGGPTQTEPSPSKQESSNLVWNDPNGEFENWVDSVEASLTDENTDALWRMLRRIDAVAELRGRIMGLRWASHSSRRACVVEAERLEGGQT